MITLLPALSSVYIPGRLKIKPVRGGFSILAEKCIVLIILSLLLFTLLTGCPVPAWNVPSLYEVYSEYFEIGTATGTVQMQRTGEIVGKHFNRLTAENDMKAGPIHPEPDEYNFLNADAIVSYAESTNKNLTGHTLVWHSQQPDWFFIDADNNPVTKEVLQNRLESHISTVVGRYKDIVDNWDVVNEAISDTPGKTYRDGLVNSLWYEIFGDEEYIKLAFEYAESTDPDALLFYNDYNAINPDKQEKIITMIQWLRNEGVKVDGIGIQAHWNLDWPPVSLIEEAIDIYAGLGLKIKISELDISIYNDYKSGTFNPEPEKEFTKALELEQAERYKTLFELFRNKKESIIHVTFWGVSDDTTWLDFFPVEDRNNYPLLFDDSHKPKEAFRAIVDF